MRKIYDRRTWSVNKPATGEPKRLDREVPCYFVCVCCIFMYKCPVKFCTQRQCPVTIKLLRIRTLRGQGSLRHPSHTVVDNQSTQIGYLGGKLMDRRDFFQN